MGYNSNNCKDGKCKQNNKQNKKGEVGDGWGSGLASERGAERVDASIAYGCRINKAGCRM